jgi:hypothetical protein
MTGRRSLKRRDKGGRPTLTLSTDPDRLIVTGAIWLPDNPVAIRLQLLGSNPASLLLQLLDSLIAPHDGVKFGFGDKDVDGEKHGVIGVANTQPEHKPNWRRRNEAPDRKLRSAPNGKTLLRSRLALLRRKVERYRDAPLSEADATFCRAAMKAWQAVKYGDLAPLVDLAGPDERARARLCAILAALEAATTPDAEKNVAQPADIAK